jgi:hypothetical protein
VAKEKRKTGRTPKLTPEVQKLIVDAVAAASPRKFAAERAGISTSTLRSWLARGRKERRGEYLAFLAAIKKAEAEAIITRIARIAKAGQGGQVVEKTTKTITVETRDGKRTTTTITTEKHAPGRNFPQVALTRAAFNTQVTFARKATYLNGWSPGFGFLLLPCRHRAHGQRRGETTTQAK